MKKDHKERPSVLLLISVQIYFINLPDDPVNFVLPTIFGSLLGTDFIGKLKLSFFHPHCSAATMLLLLLPYCNSNIYYHYSGLV